jgi:hypothetical protein
MNIILLFALSAATSQAQLPQEVEAFIVDRDACDHFRDEPTEGDSPEQIERRTFVNESLEIHCAGTDRRLAALKKRYSENAVVLSALAKFEPDIEGSRRGP